MIRNFRCLLFTPDGVEVDLTTRLQGDAVGRVSSEVEDDLLQLTHSDLTLKIDDRDGYISGLLLPAQRGEVWDFVIERETWQRRPKWERVFGGVLDIPGSIVVESRDKTVTVQVWSYSKLLEFASASVLERSLGTRTASITSGTTAVTFSPDNTPLVVGDKFTIGSEEFTVFALPSGTTVTTTANATATHTSEATALTTPYPRSDTAENLAIALCAAAGIDDTTIDLGQVLSGFLYPTAMSVTGLPGGNPDSMLEYSSKIYLYAGGHRYEAVDSASGWTDSGADTAKQDWQPYLAAAPATLRPGTRTKIYDYVAGTGTDYYEVKQIVAGATTTLKLYKNGASIADIDSVTAAAPPPDEFSAVSFEVAAEWGEIWISYRKIQTTQTKVWDPVALDWTYETHTNYYQRTVRYDTTGTLLATMNGYGPMRYVRADSRMAWLKQFGAGGTDRDDAVASPVVTFYDHGTAGTSLAAGSCDMWTFRKVGTAYYVGIDGASVRVWDATTRELLALYAIAGASSGIPTGCVFTKGGTITPEFDGWTSNSYFSLAVSSSNIIPYADFDGLSCGAAMKELAIVSAAHVFVDEYRTGHLIGRASSWITSRDPVDIDTPLEQKIKPVWDYLRRLVTITGKLEDGTDLSVSVGDQGESSLKLEVSPKIPITGGLAGVLAAAYHATLSTTPRQYEETIDEPAARPVRPLDIVERDGQSFRVLRVESSLVEREQDVLFVEESA